MSGAICLEDLSKAFRHELGIGLDPSDLRNVSNDMTSKGATTLPSAAQVGPVGSRLYATSNDEDVTSDAQGVAAALRAAAAAAESFAPRLPALIQRATTAEAEVVGLKASLSAAEERLEKMRVDHSQLVKSLEAELQERRVEIAALRSVSGGDHVAETVHRPSRSPVLAHAFARFVGCGEVDGYQTPASAPNTPAEMYLVPLPWRSHPKTGEAKSLEATALESQARLQADFAGLTTLNLEADEASLPEADRADSAGAATPDRCPSETSEVGDGTSPQGRTSQQGTSEPRTRRLANKVMSLAGWTRVRVAGSGGTAGESDTPEKRFPSCEAQSVELEDAPRGVDAMRAVDAEDEILPSEVLNLNEPFYELVRSSMVEACSAGAGNDHGEVSSGDEIFRRWLRQFHSERDDEWYAKNETRVVNAFRPHWDEVMSAQRTSTTAVETPQAAER